MARYQIPPNPQDPHEKRPRRLRQDTQEPTPWRYFLIGIVVTIVSIIMALAIVNAFLSRPPLAVTSIEPTLIVLTAPPSPIPSATPVLPTPSPIPTFTPIPTPLQATDEITVGFYAQVVNTEGAGLTIRGGPNTSNAILQKADEGDVLLIIGGPETDEPNNRLWWQVELADGTQGWAAGDFLQPSDAPPP